MMPSTWMSDPVGYTLALSSILLYAQVVEKLRWEQPPVQWRGLLLVVL